MFRNHVRVRGASAVGARGPGQSGPFGPYGRWPDEPEDDLDGGGQDDEQHDHQLPAATVAGQPTEGATP